MNDGLADGNVVGGIDAAHVVGVVGGEGLHEKVGLGHEAGDLGQVELVLHVTGVEPREEFKKQLAVEGEDAREELRLLELLGGAVLPLHDVAEASVGVADHVGPHGDGGVDGGQQRAGGLPRGVVLAHGRHALAAEEGHVAEGDEHRAVVAAEILRALHDRMARAQLLPLPCVVVSVSEITGYDVPLVADDDPRVLGGDEVRLLQNMLKKRPSRQREHGLRRRVGRGVQAGALASGWNDSSHYKIRNEELGICLGELGMRNRME